MRVVFIGSGEIGVPTLEWLAAEPGHDLVAVVCQPDRPAGRSQDLLAPPTKNAGRRHGLEIWQPESIGEVADDLRRLNADLAVVVAYGQYLPGPVRRAFPRGCVNLHASLLPRWRGASPIQAAIAAGDRETGVTLIDVAAEMDAGDIIDAEPTPSLPTDTGGSLHDRLAQIAPIPLARSLAALAAGTAVRTTQSARAVTVCRKLARDDGRIDWARPASEIERLIRAYDPWPGTSATLPDGGRIKIFPYAETVSLSSRASAPGTILEAEKHDWLVRCGEGALRVTSVQPEGRRRMSAAEFRAGHRLEPGSVLR